MKIGTEMLNFIHISDSHILNNPLAMLNGVETYFSLEQTIKDCLKKFPEVDFIICTGDISQTGERKSYEIFHSIIKKYNIPFYSVPGNHDSPQELRNIISTSPVENISKIEFDKFNLILISSVVKGENYGFITKKCLHQLKEILDEKKLPIIALHHPPLNVNSKWLDNLGLRNKDNFLEIINDAKKRVLILSGHIHQEADVALGKISIIATPSTCYQFQSKIDHPEITRLNPKYRHVQIDNYGNIETKVMSVKVELEKQLLVGG